jgi:hypothetical protein
MTSLSDLRATQDRRFTAEIVPFPSARLIGNARRVAERLAGAQSRYEADLFLNWALRARLGQLVRAGLSPREVLDQRDEFRRLIHRQCIQIGSEWMPVERDDSNRKGAA